MEEYQNKLQNIISTHFTITDTSEQGLREAAQLVQDVADSFGGCVKCWGMGWTPVESPLPTQGMPCTCWRGETLVSYMLGKTRDA